MGMEKFFKVIEGSSFHKECMKYQENIKAVNEVYKELCENVGLDAENYAPYADRLYIVTTPEIEDKFGKQLGHESRGARPFKLNSKVNKLWAEMLRKRNLKVLSKPSPAWWIPGFASGKFSTRLFEIDGTWYGSCGREFDFGDLPEGLQEMKASEFYKTIEDENERRKQLKQEK